MENVPLLVSCLLEKMGEESCVAFKGLWFGLFLDNFACNVCFLKGDYSSPTGRAAAPCGNTYSPNQGVSPSGNGIKSG